MTAHVDDADDLVLNTWSLDLATGAISNALLDTYVRNQTDVLTSLDGRGFFEFDAHMVTTREQAGSTSTLFEAWDINPFSGEISLTNSRAISVASMAAATYVPSVDPQLELYAIASQDNANTLQVTVIQWRADNDALLNLGLANSPVPVSTQGQITIAPYREGGVITVVKNDQSSTDTRMDVWSLAPNQANPTINPQAIVNNEAPISGDLFASCYVPDLSAEGDFLVSQRDFFSQNLEINAWRSGDRP